MVEIIKNVGKGTNFEYDHNAVYMPLPRRRGLETQETDSARIIDNEWYDKTGNKYELQSDYLTIIPKNPITENAYSIMDYINEFPGSITNNIIIKLDAVGFEPSDVNVLCNSIRSCTTDKRIVIDFSLVSFSEHSDLDLKNLPQNVKLSVLKYEEDNSYLDTINKYFEEWIVNQSEEKFVKIMSNLTPNLKLRLFETRKIIKDFYDKTPSRIVNGDIMTKSNYVYNWCCQNIKYDKSATNQDGTLADGRRDSQDPLNTIKRKKGVCAGRARLAKLLLNNYLMKVPCFCVGGMADRLQHEWNEVLLENGTIYDFDISKKSHRIANDHKEYQMYLEIIKNLPPIIPPLPPRKR